MNFDLERAFINKYVVKNKRQRYLGFIGSPKRRSAFLEMLYHGQDLDKSKLRPLKGLFKTEVVEWVAQRQIDSCYIISVDPALDGRKMTVAAALNEIRPYVEASVLIFGQGELIYYMGEPPHNEYLNW